MRRQRVEEAVRPPLGVAVALLISLLASTACADDARNAVQADLGLAVVGVAYERVFASVLATQFETHVFGIWWDEPKFRGFGGQIRPSIFPMGGAPGGFYVAPFVRAARVTSPEVGGASLGWSTGMFLGYSALIGEFFNLRAGGGLQYMNYELDDGAKRVEWKKLYPALDLVLGWRF